ncbi:MAG: hypothetical protein AAGB16_02920 [Pseudomonadota bacterium]
MSIETRFISPRLYFVARIAVALWAFGNFGAFAIFWGSAALGVTQPEWFQVRYDGIDASQPNSPILFVMQFLLLALMLIALWHGYQALKRLEEPAKDYSQLVRHLARFSTALFLYSIGATFVAIIRTSLTTAQESGEFAIVLAISADRFTLLIICFVLYCVCNALRAADEAVEETQSFL